LRGRLDNRKQHVGDVLETGVYTVSGEEMEMQTHFGNDKRQQWSLMRLEAP
jgi:hypothetical protein